MGCHVFLIGNVYVTNLMCLTSEVPNLIENTLDYVAVKNNKVKVLCYKYSVTNIVTFHPCCLMVAIIPVISLSESLSKKRISW